MSWLPRQMGESVRMEVVKGGETKPRGNPVGESTSTYHVFQGGQRTCGAKLANYRLRAHTLVA